MDGFVSGSRLCIQRALLVLSTNRGELGCLGHPNFGSRLLDIIGACPRGPPEKVLAGLVEEGLASNGVAYERVAATTGPGMSMRFDVVLEGQGPRDVLIIEI